MKFFFVFAFVAIGGIGYLLGKIPAYPKEQCVVCKPSGKLAMWGDCE